MKKLTDTVLVSIDFSEDRDKTILLVGRKPPNKPVDIINALQGEKAYDLWNRLTGKK